MRAGDFTLAEEDIRQIEGSLQRIAA